jgi:three-Cys-motif partner protein
MVKFSPIIEVEHDGLYTPRVREWSLEKYKLVGGYCDIFTTGMKGKWDQLVYIDLFAGAGYATIKESGKTYLSSALIAMSVPNPFAKYILCEENPERFCALSSRVERGFSHLDVTLINGDCNKVVEEIFRSIPAFYKGNTVLHFCFIDPYSLNINFRTIEILGRKKSIDFLILQALHMTANRNLKKFIQEENDRIALYLGDLQWREKYDSNSKKYSTDFVRFLADQYTRKMAEMNYIPEKNTHQIKSNIKNLPLYYLAFYSKHPTGIDYYKRVEKYASKQLKMDL